MKTSENQKPNKLINEKNPYLLQHAYNPVEWYPWCDEAFIKARKEDKPVFLSIGYSTCHWCHVMAHESFEDLEVAELMNRTFINIKVDREERPDIDGVYMDVCQMIIGSGGWPLTIIMTPDKNPFFAGTYFPKNTVIGRIGMTELIPKVANYWNNNRDDVYLSANDITAKLNTIASSNNLGTLDKTVIDKAFGALQLSYDEKFGGFNNKPKFPIPHNLTFLLRYYINKKDEIALKMVEKTLTEMSMGGIYDHIGFGFHRYSTDREWLVPHFEKMLYDQALLSIAFTETYMITKNEKYKNITEDILTYIQRDMTNPLGSFLSAEDADSEGIEGKFYLWYESEIEQLLSEDFELFKKAYNVNEYGNFVDESGHSLKNTNILHKSKKIDELAGLFELSSYTITNKLETCRKILFGIRESRIHPHKDDKVLCDWNSLMISAFAIAGRYLNNSKYIEIADNSMDFIIKRMIDVNGFLLHRYNDGEAGITANIDDYAFLIKANLDLYEATFRSGYLKIAINYNKVLLQRFWDNANGGFYFTPDFGEKLIVRKKDIYDGAIPSGNSIQLLNLLKLAKITGNSEYQIHAEKLKNSCAGQISRMASGYTQFLSGVLFSISSSEIVLTAENQEQLQPFIEMLKKYFLPNAIVITKTNDNKDDIEEIAAFTKNLNMIDGKPTAYICKDFTCDLPVNDLETYEMKIKELSFNI